MNDSRRWHAKMLVGHLRTLVTGRYGRGHTLDDPAKRRWLYDAIKHDAKRALFGGR